MNSLKNLLIEIRTEELPPKSLQTLAEAFKTSVGELLTKAKLPFSNLHSFATPRRIAIRVDKLAAQQEDQVVERRGPALSAAYDEAGHPSKACLGFLRGANASASDLTQIQTEQGTWVGVKQHVAGQTLAMLLPSLLEDALSALPIARRMRAGDDENAFVRPIHSVIALYGDEVVPFKLFNFTTGRVTRGHRFHAPEELSIPSADVYEKVLEKKGHVIVDFAKRRDLIRQQALACAAKLPTPNSTILWDEALLSEVTGLVEWPIALSGHYDEAFLKLPPEVLISAMQDHQRYFPVCDPQSKLLPYFITMSNIQSHTPERVIQGNERVLRARLSDAVFFYATDQKIRLDERVPRLKEIIFQKQLGSLYDKTVRIGKLAGLIAQALRFNPAEAERAGFLAKADLMTEMVGEFPELQGTMGYYYALQNGEVETVARSLQEQYLPRFANDRLPATEIGQALALADRMDTLVGIFGVNQIPTGDKDPFGLRRQAIGVLRILIEGKLALDLRSLIEQSLNTYAIPLPNQNVKEELLRFMLERLRHFYQEQGISPDVYAAVAALNLSIPLDIHRRILAVQHFKGEAAAEALCIANKRVSNILDKYSETLDSEQINPKLFEHAIEHALAKQIEEKYKIVMALCAQGNYQNALLQLAELREPLDTFFDQVMVMTEDKARRENRLRLLSKLRALFLQTADIALLQ